VGILGKRADRTWPNASGISYEVYLTMYLLHIFAFSVLPLEVSRDIVVRKACGCFYAYGN